MQPIIKLRKLILETQRVREDLVEQLQSLITSVKHEIEEAEEPAVRAEWIRLLGFLSQTLNSVMKAYDQVRLDEDLQKAKEVFDKLEELQERLKEREEVLKRKEEELNRREQALKTREQ